MDKYISILYIKLFLYNKFNLVEVLIKYNVNNIINIISLIHGEWYMNEVDNVG